MLQLIKQANALDNNKSKCYYSGMCNPEGTHTMSFSTYFSSLSARQKKELANKADTSVAYLRQISTGHRNAGLKTARNLLAADPNIDLEMFDIGGSSAKG